jgi:hypothetical protein
MAQELDIAAIIAAAIAAGVSLFSIYLTRKIKHATRLRIV